MNYKMVLSMIGNILLIEAALMIPALMIALIYQESCSGALGLSLLLTGAVGLLLKTARPQQRWYGSQEGMMITGFSWILLSAFGALPFFLSGQIPSYIDAFFVTVSGFTTTGSTILRDGNSCLSAGYPAAEQRAFAASDAG